MIKKDFLNKLVSIIFVAILLIGGLAEITISDKETSSSERRNLQQFPVLTSETLTNGSFFDELNDYITDQLPLRDSLRQIKAICRYYLLGMTENNDIVIYDQSAIKLKKRLNEKLTMDNVLTWSDILEDYLPKDVNVLYSIIPDKAYYLPESYPKIDYQKLSEIVADYAPENAATLDLSSLLTLSDYYTTDLHWRQDSIYSVAESIADYFDVPIDSFESYSAYSIEDFYGTYYGQSALPLSPDTLTVMNNKKLDSVKAVYYRYENNALSSYSIPVYNTENINESDMYSLYLGGSEGIVEITNDAATSDKTLLIYRDSFASSLTPYLISGYKRIIMIDSRYVAPHLLSEFSELHLEEVNDVLFIYSVTTLTETQFKTR